MNTSCMLHFTVRRAPQGSLRTGDDPKPRNNIIYQGIRHTFTSPCAKISQTTCVRFAAAPRRECQRLLVNGGDSRVIEGMLVTKVPKRLGCTGHGGKPDRPIGYSQEGFGVGGRSSQRWLSNATIAVAVAAASLACRRRPQLVNAGACPCSQRVFCFG